MARRPDSQPDIATHSLSVLLRDTLSSGRKPLDTPDIGDAVVVHDLRKTFKRWRALLRLVAPVVGAEAETLRIEARDLAREMASARDSDAAVEALADFGDPPSLSARFRASIEARIAEAAGAEGTALSQALKARMRDALLRAATAAEQWPLDRFDCEEATRQLTATYRRACAAIPRDWSKAGAETLHQLRRRVVEHRYQMELVEPAWPKLIRLWVSEAQRLRDRLGSYQDLVVLQGLAAPHQPLAHWRARLTPLIVARQADHVAGAQRLAGRLFAERPKAFRRRIAALWQHRADTGAKIG